MITEHEIQISNMSYTEKDFASIYPTLLDLTKQLTNKWDPSISNESDPGNVLLKLLAAIGDKTNYNIDKNVLECFMPSATQETSMRMLTEAVGYNMKYYQSATTDITFKYTEDLERATFNKFSTVITNQDSSVAYTLIDDVTLMYKNGSVSGRAIEGQLTDLLVGDQEVIKLDNLDDNNRLYFPEIYVAENGVFITNDGFANFNEWQKVDNLNTQIPLTRCYKFGYDSKAELPYIEFPTDIAQLLGSGIRVSYIVTHADDGNVSAGTLTNVASTNVDTLDFDNLVVFNPAAAVNGKTKETIDEAYNNFKKIIGTFDTLVTTRDYGNAMYNLVDEYNKPMVSNAMASDRTDDINYGLKVVTYDNQGQYTEIIPNDDMSTADLVLYPMKPYKGENYNIYNPSYVYDESYQPLKVYKQQNSQDYMVDDEVLVSELDNLKCIGHVFKDLPFTYANTDDRELVYNFRNIANLDAQIFTYAKVNAIEQAEIKSNVLKALSDNFNARMVDYGYEIPYDKLLDVIYAADSRIKLVNLGEPEYYTDIMYVDGTNESVFNSDGEVMTNVVAKNVLAGKISLFLYDDRFDWQFGQTAVNTYDNVSAITTSLIIPVSENIASNNKFSYTMDKNEVIQLIAPTLSTKLIYPAGVYYRFGKNGAGDPGVIIKANTDYKIKDNQFLNLYYVDSNERKQFVTIPSGTIVRPSFDMYYTTDGVITVNDNDADNLAYDKINTNKTLEIREFVTVKLDNIGTPVYWIRNNKNNELFPSTDNNDTSAQTIILDSGEYFIYSNSNFDDLVVLGAGTSITRVGYSDQWAIPNAVSVESINLNGVNAFESGDWQYKQFTSNCYVTLQEMQIITADAGTNIVIGPNVSAFSGVDMLTGEWLSLDGDATITINSNALSSLEDAGASWQIRTRLDLNAGPNNPQTLVSTSKHTQAIFVALASGGDVIEIDGTNRWETNQWEKCILFNYPVKIAGGNNIDMKVTNILLGTSSYALSLAEYLKVGITSNPESLAQTIDPSTTINFAIGEDGTYVKLPMSIDYIETEEPSQEAIAAGASGTYNYQPYGTYIVPVLFTQGDPSTTVSVVSNCANIYEYNTYNNSHNKVAVSTLSSGGLYNLELVAKWSAEYGNLSDLTHARPMYAPVDLTAQPSNWPTGYYTRSGTSPNYTYSAVPGGTTFAAGTYYVKPNKVDDRCCCIGYVLLSSQPSDWAYNWSSYYLSTLSEDGEYNALYTKLNENVVREYSSWTWTTAGGYTYPTWSTIPTGHSVYRTQTSMANVGKIYRWDGDSWEEVSYTGIVQRYIQFTGNVSGTPDGESFLTIGKIHKVMGLNPAIESSMRGDLVLDEISTLTDDITNEDGVPVKFYYCYEPSNSDVIETDNMISPEAFWDVNNIANKFTIPKLDLDNSKIYIARASQL